ncbi:9572_t:CDS:1 [Acaulospora morrowiae]|uniref:Small ribosomal subunit protein uS3m n=1 Tax=Acaulospora morrowiae TaxID=94023 RepID=A0A9N9FTM0_9GLOM|nr:9572_t:CDS:1 [Acaulospora morrowiae]
MNSAKALRLKNKLNWQTTQFLFHPSKSHNFNYDLNALRAIEHYMQKPINDISVRHTPTKVVFRQYFYPGIQQPPREGVIPSSEPPVFNSNVFDQKYLDILKERLGKMYNKDVEFQLIRQRYPFLNARILAQYIASNTSRYRIRQIRRSLFKKIPLVGRSIGETKKVSKSSLLSDLNAASPTKWIQLSRIGHRFLPIHLSGFRMRISGRMSLRKGAARASKATSSMGSFRFNTIKNTMIDYAKVERKNQNGAYCVKVWLSSSVA